MEIKIILLSKLKIDFKLDNELNLNKKLMFERIIEKYPSNDLIWGKFGLSMNKKLTLEILEKYPEKPWEWGRFGITSNPNLTLEWIKKYPEKPWDWGGNGLSKHPNLTLEWIEKYPEKPWDWGRFEITSNPNLILEWMDKYPNKKWQWGMNGISRYIKYKQYIDNKTLNNNQDNNNSKWIELSSYSKVNTKFLYKNIDKPWDWNKIGVSKKDFIDMKERIVLNDSFDDFQEFNNIKLPELKNYMLQKY